MIENKHFYGTFFQFSKLYMKKWLDFSCEIILGVCSLLYQSFRRIGHGLKMWKWCASEGKISDFC